VCRPGLRKQDEPRWDSDLNVALWDTVMVRAPPTRTMRRAAWPVRAQHDPRSLLIVVLLSAVGRRDRSGLHSACVLGLRVPA
jgi:hypothetical protein